MTAFEYAKRMDGVAARAHVLRGEARGAKAAASPPKAGRPPHSTYASAAGRNRAWAATSQGTALGTRKVKKVCRACAAAVLRPYEQKKNSPVEAGATGSARGRGEWAASRQGTLPGTTRLPARQVYRAPTETRPARIGARLASIIAGHPPRRCYAPTNKRKIHRWKPALQTPSTMDEIEPSMFAGHDPPAGEAGISCPYRRLLRAIFCR